MSEQSFFELMEEVRAGKQEAAAELMRRYAPQIRRIARIRLGRTHLQRLVDSADICQSVMAKFFQRAIAGEFELDTPEQLVRLLATMARNQVIKRAAYHQARRRDLRRLASPDEVEDMAVDPQGTPSLLVSNAELVAKLRGILSADEQQLLDDRLQGRAWVDIAAEMAVPTDRIRKRFTRAMERAVEVLGLTETPD